MPAANRASIETVDIGRGNHYEPRHSQAKPIRRSSTVRSDEWDSYERSIPTRYDRYDDYRPRYEVVEVRDGAGRPISYHDNDYYDRWQESSGPVRHYVSPSYTRHSAQNQMVGVRPRPRSPTPVDYDDDERMITSVRSKRVAAKPAAVVGDEGGPKARKGSQHVPGLFQTVFDVNHPQDASVHLELPITDDHGAELEEFCRLQRLGNFGAAEDHFKNKLEPYLSNPYVFVQFGQMLLEKGDYHALERLNSEAVFGKEDRPPSRFHLGLGLGHEKDDEKPELALDLKARRHSRSRSPSIDNVQRPYERDRYVERDRSYSPDGEPEFQDTKPNPDYDELELLRQNWRLLKATSIIYSKGNYEDAFSEAWYTIETLRFGTGIGSTEASISPERYHSGLREAAREWVDWPTLFKELLAQGRIWDFKDLYIAIVAAFSDSEDNLFLGTDDIKRSLVDDWVLEEGDESTNLALLDMLLEPAQLRSYFPDEAKSRAEAIIAHSPAVMKSRSFIRWILANATDAVSGEKKGDDDLWLALKTHLQGFPGIELKDYNAQVACYKLLIFQSQDPTELFQELAHLQKSIQGDKKGHLETLLSSYLVCKDRPGKEKLLEELGQSDDWGDATVLRDGLTYWARDFIERAVKRSLQGPKSTARLRNPASFYMGKGLPWVAEHFTWQNTELDRLPPSSAYRPETYIPRSETYVQEAERQERELDQAKKEIQAWKEKQAREVKNQQDRETRERLEQAERRLREQEEINKKQKEETKMREMELERLEQEIKQAKERQILEARAQQDRETRERLERAELSLRDQAERLRRAEDRSYQEWLSERHFRGKARARGKFIRGRRGTRFVAASTASSESYYSDRSPSRDNEDSSDDTSIRAKKRTKSTSSDSEGESEQEIRINRRVRSVEELRSEPRRGEANHQDGEDTGSLQRNSCTDLILYRELQDLISPDAYMSGTHPPRLPTSQVSSSDEARGSRRGSTTGPDPTRENDEAYPQEQTDHLTAEPQEVEDQLDQPESAISRSETGETGDDGSSHVRRAESRDHSEIRSKEQNARIANRPSRPASTGIYVSPRPSVDDSTGVWDAWEERMRKANRRVVIDPGPSGSHTVSPRPRSRPSSTQAYDDIQPLGRRTSWRDSPVGSPHGDRLGSPTKRRSLIIDADGRPQPVRTGESRRSYSGDSPSGTCVRVIRSAGAGGGRPMPEMSPTATRLRSRPHSTGGVATRLHRTDPIPIPKPPEKPSAENWERVKDGLWRKRKPSTLHEDPEEGEEKGPSQPQTQARQGESSKDQDSLDPAQQISRKSTVADPEPSEE
ncbi:hypothetical protein INS49_015704 [Diaporthe citri]|uniref:uncharacterized protein n=1 Tax=Diaporthe citri TaxID=83186 RepID=UPI001C818884|nr:uncharacterized protein INS49_015704 [Diaporthe citri]KAG6356317.1 hypothetical protein INS49_015704 [Diaporthe citri]